MSGGGVNLTARPYLIVTLCLFEKALGELAQSC
jgi:hypothetical protein